MSVTYDVLKHFADMTQTPEEILASLPPVTPNAINLQALRVWLRDEGLLIGGIRGALVAVLDNDAAPSALKDGVAKLIDILRLEGPPLPTNLSNRAGEIGDMIRGLLTLGVITEPQATAFYAMGGGLRFADLTEAEIAEAIATHDLQAKIVNAHAQALHLLSIEQTPEEQAAAWAQAWGDVS